MAKRRSANPDRYANRYRGRLSLAAAAATAVFESFNTGLSMTGQAPHKWDILWFSIMPNTVAAAPGHATDSALLFQLMYGTQVAMLNGDDMQLVCGGVVDTDILTSGAGPFLWPAYAGVRSPIPCLASVLTVGLQAITDAAYNSTEWVYEIGYVTRPAAVNEAAEFFASVGGL